MNREIKFRAWNKKYKFMYDNIVVFPSNNTDFIYNAELHSKHFNLPSQTTPLKDVIVMQYTGLKAKGKEMYEGDIVREQNESGVFIYQIMWDKYDCCFYPEPVNFKTQIQERMSSRYTEFEIIGNIYENPELLK